MVNKEKQDSGSDSEIDEESVKMAIRQREQQLKDAQLLYEYRQRLRETTLETFTDKPDPVT